MAPTSSRFSSNSEEFPTQATSKRPSTSALVSLAAIGLVVLLVALPSLRGLALRENETDAVRLIRALGAACLESPESNELNIGALFSATPALQHRFGDLEHLPEHAVLRTHGYLFDLVQTDDGPTLRAWPWSHGRTGHTAFALSLGGKILGHPNSEGSWSGTRSARAMPASLGAGWRAMP